MRTGKTVGFCVLRFHEHEQMETFLVHSLTWAHGVSRWSRTLHHMWTCIVHTHTQKHACMKTYINSMETHTYAHRLQKTENVITHTS